jgi:hypothetical protein
VANRPAPKRLTVTFHKVDEPRRSAWWEAVRPTGGRMTGGHMPIGKGVIPHDLAHLVTEGHLGIDDGVWGLLARGATFSRGTSRRATNPGRQLVRDHRGELHHAEQLGNHHHFAWVDGHPTEVGASFERFATAWTALPHGGTLTVEWPSLELRVSPHRSRRSRDGSSTR